MTHQKNNFLRGRATAALPARQRRGSVIVLVVAVLGLLAVIGTVYIVSARTERQSANASAVGINLDFARSAVISQATDIIGSSNVDALGVVGGYNIVGSYGSQVARRWDIPEIKGVVPPLPAYNASYRDEPWLVTDLYRIATNSYASNDFSLLTPAAFDPATGQYDLTYSSSLSAVASYYPTATTPAPYPDSNVLTDSVINLLPFSEAGGLRYRFGVRIIDTNRMANLNVGAASADTSSATLGDPSGTYFTSYALAHPDLFNGDSIGALDGTGVNSGGRVGAFWPLPAAPSLYYAWSRIPLQFESPGASFQPVPFQPASPFGLDDEMELRSYGDLGTLFTPRPAHTGIWPLTLSNQNGTGIVGNARRGNYTTYSYSRELRPFLLPVDANIFTAGSGNAYTLIPSTGVLAFNVPISTDPQPFAGTVWPPFPARVAADPDIVSLGTSDLVADSLAMAATNIGSAMEFAIRTGIPLSPMDQYTHEEACAFAANYMTYRWNSWTTTATVSYKTLTNVPVRNLFSGPSFVDSQGLCIRATADGTTVYGRNYGSVTDLAAEIPPVRPAGTGKVYLGYAAQPFINEAAESVQSDGTTNDPIADSAVELYNPYNVALSLNDYQLQFVNSTATTTTIPLTGYIPPRGYFVIVQQPAPAGHFSTLIAVDAQSMSAVGLDLTTVTGKIYLMRKFVDRSNAIQYGAVDQYDVSALNTAVQAFRTPVPTAGPHDIYVRRSNDDGFGTSTDPRYLLFGGSPNRWSATIETPASESNTFNNDNATATELMSLGSVNHTDSGVAGIPLYDRNAEFPALSLRANFANIAEFNRIMRITNEIDMTPTTAGVPAGGPANSTGALSNLSGDGGVISAQIVFKETTPYAPILNTQFPAEAAIHFDFRAAPWLYSALAPATTGIPNELQALPAPYKTDGTGPPFPGDLRAVHLLECLAFVDRVSDFSIDIGDNTTSNVSGALNRGISKIRIPGQINVNTASPQVLSSIPVLNNNPALVGAILAYRWRTTNTDPRIPSKYGTVPFNFSDPTAYPGYGIRSLAELNVALSLNPILASNPSLFVSPPTTLDQRDALWADVYNYCTVRSDTFVLYGYLEAVRQNPRYTGTFDNSTAWYINDFNAGDVNHVTDDPTDASAKLLRVARRRFIAIIDRSGANANRVLLTGLANPPTNPNFTAPRIVAIKDLPQ